MGQKEVENENYCGVFEMRDFERFFSEVLIMAINRCIDPVSKNGIQFWYENTALSRFTGVSPEKLNADALYRCMDTLTDNVILSIEEKIANKLTELFNISFETLVYDITSTYFEGTECDLAKYGYNRDGLSGKLQIELGLVISKDGKFPIYHEVFKGNTSDVTTVRSTANRLTESFSPQKCTLIMDRGMVSEENINELDNLTYGIICGLKKNVAEVRRLITSVNSEELIQEKNCVKKSEEGNIYAMEIMTELYGRNRKIIICLNEAKRKHDKEKRDEAIQKAEEELKRISEKITNGKYKDILKIADEINEALDGIKTYFPRTFNYENGKIEFTYRKNTTLLKQAEKMDGYYALMCSNIEAHIDEIIASYFSDKDKVEQAFKCIKNPIRIRPINHRKLTRVKAHVFICVLGYLLRTMMDYILARAESGANAEQATQLLHRIKLITLHFAGNYTQKLTQLSDEQKKIFDALIVKGI